MSAPRTNLETEKRRHKGPLIGMALVVIFGVGLIVYWQFEEAAQGNSPTPDAVQPAQTGTDPAAAPVAEE
jgi:hypothetical protein